MDESVDCCPAIGRVGGGAVSAYAVEARDLSLAYGRRVIMPSSTFALKTGSVTVLLGRNGIGKTTLLRAIQGIVRPSGGTLSVLGTTPARARARIGAMAQRRDIAAPQLRAFDVIAAAWHGACFGLPILSAQARDAVDRAVALAGAQSLVSRPYGTLSGGQRQRVGLAQALLGRPELLLLDEPLAGLDPAARRTVLDAVLAVREELGLTVLLCAHEPEMILPRCDHALALSDEGARLYDAGALTPARRHALYGRG